MSKLHSYFCFLHRAAPGIVLLLLLWQSVPSLISAWTTSPRDQFAWIALLAWLVPCVTQSSDARREIYAITPALFFSALGTFADLNVLYHWGLAFSIACFLPRHSLKGYIASMVWIFAALSWMPAFGWLTVVIPTAYVPWARIAFASAGSFFAIATISQRHDTATMVPRRFDKRWLFVASAIASIGYVVCWFSSESVSRLSDLPIAGEEFRSAPMPLNPQETQAIGDAIAIRRWYQFKSTQAIVTVVDGTLNRHAIHDLLYCVRGAGWEICSDQPLDLPCGAGRMITSRKGDEEAVLVYWFSDRKVRHGSFLKYRLQTALRRITAGKSGLEPYLIVIQSCGQQPADWRELLAPDSPFFYI